MRKVICHYHIYKNSGSSFDALLKKNYGDALISFDGPFAFFSIDQEQLGRIIQRYGHAIAFSSHQTRLPVPVSLDFRVLPVVFIRHPLLRIRSIYQFKRKQDDGTKTSAAARSQSFDEWIGYCFSDAMEITQVSNAQTRIVGGAYQQNPLVRRVDERMICDVDQALRNLKNVELLGRTEFFDQDVGCFAGILERHGLDFKFDAMRPRNVTVNNLHKTIDERVAEIEDLLSAENYRRLRSANDQDMQLFDYVSNLRERAQ